MSEHRDFRDRVSAVDLGVRSYAPAGPNSAGITPTVLPLPSGFVCPVDRHSLIQQGEFLTCTDCMRQYPIVRGVPVLINDAASVFSIADYQTQSAYQGDSGYGGALDTSRGLRKAYHRFARRLNYAPMPGGEFDFLSAILAEIPNAKILVIGAGERRFPCDATYTDVAFANGISCICDSHDIPYPDNTFDAVIADSVLEHVCDPQRCVAEYTRVLKPRGFVYAVTPFLQPGHLGAYDFTRFTHLGHRRLFRQFDEVASGRSGGPVYAAIHLFREQLQCLTDHHHLKSLLRLIGLLITYPIRYLDPLFSRNAQSYNSACAFYFLGRKREAPIPDREIIKQFRGR